MKTKKFKLGNLEVLVIGDTAIQMEYAKTGRKLKNNSTLIKPYYAEKLKILEDNIYYVYNHDVNSPDSIYAYCDYILSLEKLKDIV